MLIAIIFHLISGTVYVCLLFMWDQFIRLKRQIRLKYKHGFSYSTFTFIRLKCMYSCLYIQNGLSINLGPHL